MLSYTGGKKGILSRLPWQTLLLLLFLFLWHICIIFCFFYLLFIVVFLCFTDGKKGILSRLPWQTLLFFLFVVLFFMAHLYWFFVSFICCSKSKCYRWQERDFESTSLTDDSWANVVFRSRPSALATKTRKGFPLSYLGSNKSIFLIRSLKRWQGGSDSVS